MIRGAGLTLVAALGLAAPAEAIEVDTLDDLVPDDPPDNGCEATADSNLCTLREAVERANGQAGADVVTFKSGLTGTATLNGSDLNIGPLGMLGDLSIQGPGADLLTISGNDQSRIFDLYTPDAFTVSGVTLTGGNGSGGFGGAIASAVPTDVTVTDSAVVGNASSGVGGGILAAGDGSGDTLTIENTTISGNNASTSGGGIWADETQVVIRNSTISGNHANTGEGGGVDVYDNGDNGDELIVDSSTIAGNTSATVGGGIYFLTTPDITELSNTIVAGNTAPDGPDIGGGSSPLNVNASFSLIEDAGQTNLIDGVPVSLITETDPLLGPLQPNGGPTQTRLPAHNSPVVDKGRELTLLGDQRGKPRPFDVPAIPNSTQTGANAADMGAVELTLAEATPPVTPTTPGVTPTTPAAKKKKCKKGKKSAVAAKKKKKCKKKKRR